MYHWRDKVNTPNHYQTEYLIAKVVICLIVIALGTLSIETGNFYISLIPGTIIWFFDVYSLAELTYRLIGGRLLRNQTVEKKISVMGFSEEIVNHVQQQCTDRELEQGPDTLQDLQDEAAFASPENTGVEKPQIRVHSKAQNDDSFKVGAQHLLVNKVSE